MSKKVFQIELSIELYLHDSVDEGTFGKRSRSIDRFAVIFRPPRGAVNVDMVWIKAECSRFNGVIDSAVQHPHAADAGVKSDANTAKWIKRNGGYFSGASRSVFIVAVVSWHRIVIVVVNIRAGQRILFQFRRNKKEQ